MADDTSIRAHIKELVAEEHDLRRKLMAGAISADEEHSRLADIETELDQCWDLLRQRDARRQYGGDPDEASARSGETVEGYLG